MWCGCLEPSAESVARWLGGSSASVARRHVLKDLTALLARGYGRADVAKVVGDNVARVLRATIG